jgi:hypothetical protein
MSGNQRVSALSLDIRSEFPMDAWLTNGAFLLAWAAGIFIILWTVLEDGPKDVSAAADIKVFGATISIKGRSPLCQHD